MRYSSELSFNKYCGTRRGGRFVVGGGRAIGRADVFQHASRGSGQLRQRPGRVDFAHFGARHQHFSVASQRRQG